MPSVGLVHVVVLLATLILQIRCSHEQASVREDGNANPPMENLKEEVTVASALKLVSYGPWSPISGIGESGKGSPTTLPTTQIWQGVDHTAMPGIGCAVITPVDLNGNGLLDLFCEFSSLAEWYPKVHTYTQALVRYNLTPLTVTLRNIKEHSMGGGVTLLLPQTWALEDLLDRVADLRGTNGPVHVRHADTLGLVTNLASLVDRSVLLMSTEAEEQEYREHLEANRGFPRARI